jgi:indole-3-glycerol phosphate synthase/phosphoribosylanthranilate isomerase
MGRFAEALARPGLTAVAEIKRRSPSAGDLRPDADPARIAAAYEAAGAAAVSVLVDERFGGTWDDLRAARAAVGLPLLAKGFFSTEEDLREAREAGADTALLLLRDLDDARMRRLLSAAAALGLETLVEAHDADELDRALGLDAPIIGINARDLSTFEIDRRRQLELVAAGRGRAPDSVVVAESGIASRAQGAAAELAGADAILVGSTLMRAADPAAKLAELVSRPLVKVCGLTRDEDVAAAAEAGADLLGFVLVDGSPRRARGVLQVSDAASDAASDTLLTVAVVVGTSEADGADLVQRYEEEPGKVRGRDAVLLRDGAEVARVVDLPWGEDDPWHLERARAVEGRVMLAGGLGPENVAAAIAKVRPWAVDASSSLELAPGVKDHARVRAYVEAARR